MPRHLDQLPPDMTTISRKIAALQRELRAAKRAAYTTVTNGKTTYASEGGWDIVMDPGNDLPIVYFRDPNGAEMAALNATGSPGRPGFNLSSGPFGDNGAVDWRWVTFAGQTEDGANNNCVTARLQTSDVNRRIGGWLYLDPASVQLGLVNTDTGVNQIFQIADSMNAPASPARRSCGEEGHRRIGSRVPRVDRAPRGPRCGRGRCPSRRLAPGRCGAVRPRPHPDRDHVRVRVGNQAQPAPPDQRLT